MGTDLNNLVPLGTLVPVEDEAYTHFSVKVMAFNANRFYDNASDDLDT